jgi:hypothetical protein
MHGRTSHQSLKTDIVSWFHATNFKPLGDAEVSYILLDRKRRWCACTPKFSRARPSIALVIGADGVQYNDNLPSVRGVRGSWTS